MKQRPELQAIQANMLPGKFSADGFLGEDDRSLADILLEDQKAVDRLGLTHEAIAARMCALTEQGKSGLGKPITIDNAYEVVVEDYMGRIPCPFRDNRGNDKRSTTVRRLSDGKVLGWTDLSIHMIDQHGFYEGRGSAYRLEPAELADFLGLTKIT